MKGRRLIGVAAAVLLLFQIVMPATSLAKGESTIEDESIYDLLVDRFNNGDGKNDIDVDAQDPFAFNGGDFAGIASRLQHIIDMGFTLISIGPVFETETYDGGKPLSYTKLEPHFGTEDELKALLKEVHNKKLKLVADFPLGKVSANHEWVKEDKIPSLPAENGTVNWDVSDSTTVEALTEAVVEFATSYDLDGIRLTKIDAFSDENLNSMISAIRNVKPDMYILTDEESEANFDASPNTTVMDALRQTFATSDPDSSVMDVFDKSNSNGIIQFDDLAGSRLTYEMVEARMFPPTRWKVAATALFTLPGIPLVPYGTEIAVNGKEAPESHPFFNFKTDMELAELIGNLNLLRNQSETLRNGDFEMLHNKGGFLVYKRSSKDETWIIAINNTTKTASVEIPVSKIGDNKKLRGLLDSDLIRESDDDVFRIVLDREMAEVYIADEDKGYNTPYLIASILVYIIFLGFLFTAIKKGRARRKQENSIEKK